MNLIVVSKIFNLIVPMSITDGMMVLLFITIFVLLSAHAPISTHPCCFKKVCIRAHCLTSIVVFYISFAH